MSDPEEECQSARTQTNSQSSTTIPSVIPQISPLGDVDNMSSESTQTDLPIRPPECLPEEESNFLRFCHLVQKVAPEAIRDRFDKEFPPDELEGIISSKIKELEESKKTRIITKSQWGLIFPKGSPPVSSSFDVTLMVCLFRHLTTIIPQSGNYDTLPPPSDSSLGADLARIKYYRNNISHYLEKDRKLDNIDFPIVWETVTEAVGRIGGPDYEKKCVNLLTVKLDNSYMEIYRDILNVLMREEELKEEIETLKVKNKDPLRENERGNINALLKQWESSDEKFAETRAAIELKTSLSTKNAVIVTGSPGSGKSSTAQHVLLGMKKEGYDVIQVKSASDMVRYFNEENKQVFYIDDLLGKHYVLKSVIDDWEQNDKRLKCIFSSSKCIFTCRLQIYQDPLFKNLHLENCEVINLAGGHKLSVKEKKNVGKQYLQQSVLGSISNNIIERSICFPLLCSLFDGDADKAPYFFETPEKYFKDELTKMKEKPDKIKYACIAVCVMFNNNVPFEIFKAGPSRDINEVILGVLEELEVNVINPKKTLQHQFESLVDSLLKRSTTGYQSIHDYMFDIYCSHVGNEMTMCIIEYADSQLLSERVILQSTVMEAGNIEKHFRKETSLPSFRESGSNLNNLQQPGEGNDALQTEDIDKLVNSTDSFKETVGVNKEHELQTIGEFKQTMIIIPSKYEDDFFRRILTDFENGEVCNVLTSYQMINKSYRLKLISFLIEKRVDFERVDKSGIVWDSAILICLRRSYFDILTELCSARHYVDLCDKYTIQLYCSQIMQSNEELVRMMLVDDVDDNTVQYALSCFNEIEIKDSFISHQTQLNDRSCDDML